METKEMVPKLRFPEFNESNNVSELKEVSKIYGRIGYRGYTVNDIVNKGEGAIALSPGNIINGLISYDNSTHISWEKYDESPEIKINNSDIILVKTGSTYGKSAFVKDLPGPTTLNPQIVVFKNISLNNNFLSYVISSIDFLRYLEKIVVGGAIPTISQEQISRYRVAYPSSKEQKKIASFLSSVDEKISLLEKKKTLLETYKRGIMQKIFSQELRFKDENGEEFPDWEEIKMGDLFSDKVMSCETQNQMLSVTINSGIRLFEEIGKKDNSNSDKSKYKLVNIGDIVYNTMRAWQGAIGVSKYDGFVSPAYTVLDPKPNAYNLYFGYFFKMKSVIKIFERHSQGLTSDQWSMKYNSFRTIKFFVPCFEEQRKISSFISILDKKIEITSTQLEKTREFKKGLLQQMFV